jgi:hypothetical protein
MFDPTAMIMADKATKHHVLSARPKARTTPERPPRQRSDAMRRLTVVALRRLANRLEPRRVETSVPVS